MDKLVLLSDSLTYIENHLEEEIQTEDVATACYCSRSTLEQLFRCVNRITVREYIIRRRMMKAARILVEQPKVGILTVALQFGYSTNESFTRAFRQVWNCNPSEFRRKTRFSELFPRFDMKLKKEGGNFMEQRKHVDISELYDLFKERRQCYFVCCDIKSLIPINEISRKAGDLAILEAMRRMEEAAGENDVIFRIGGDEFVLLTDSEDRAHAEQIAEKIRQYNNAPFTFEGKEIPLSLFVGITKFGEKTLKYDELFAKLHEEIAQNKHGIV